MSEDENFLARWSSRKLASRTPAAASEAPQRPREDGVENAAVAAPAKDARLAGNVVAALPEATPRSETKEVSTSDKNCELAGNAPSAQPLEAAPKAADPVDDSNDAAQQNETGKPAEG